MSTITTRAGKGSQLTWTEVDSNFTNLNTDKIQSSNAGSTGNVLTRTAGGAEWATPAGGGPEFLFLNYNAASNQVVSGETKRGTITELYDPANISTLLTSFTMSIPAGTYLVQWGALSGSGATQTLHNVTDGAALITDIFGTTGNVNFFTITATKTVDLRFVDSGFSGRSGRLFLTKVA
jgi:hypothetical protein